jgi:hypothetical protein
MNNQQNFRGKKLPPKQFHPFPNNNYHNPGYQNNTYPHPPMYPNMNGYQFQRNIPEMPQMYMRPIPKMHQNFRREYFDSTGFPMHMHQPFTMNEVFSQNEPMQGLFKKNVPQNEPSCGHNEVLKVRRVPAGERDIQVEHLDSFSQKSGEDLIKERNLEENQNEEVKYFPAQEEEKEFFDQKDPKITIVSPHLVQYFKKNAKRLSKHMDQETKLNLKMQKGGSVLLKTKVTANEKSTLSKLRGSRKIKKEKTKSQKNYLTINQHINIQNINPPMMGGFYEPMRQTRHSFPMHNPAQDYQKFKEMFPPSRNSSHEEFSNNQEPDNVRKNWDLICELNLEDKLFLDVSTNNVYLKVDNKNDLRFKNFEHLRNQSMNLEEAESQLVPLAESLLPNHLQNLRQLDAHEPNFQTQSFLEADLNELNLEPGTMSNRRPVTQIVQKKIPKIVKKVKYKNKINLKLKKKQNDRKIKKEKIGCKCSKSKCLRLHCLCFKKGSYCSRLCGCDDCFNVEEHKDLVEKVKKATKDINSTAFESKFLELEREGNVIQITKGCTCMKNNCLKNYCECRKNGMQCTTLCKCDQCFNDQIQLTQEEVMKLHTKSSRKKKKIIFQTKIEQNI